MNVFQILRFLTCAWARLAIDSPSPPPPDPAIGQAAAANAEIGREALAFQKQVYEESKPRQTQLNELTDTVIQQFIEAQGKSSAAADDYLDYMRSVFRPIETGLAKDAMEFDTEARREELAGLAGADVEQAAGLADAQARRDAARYGINPADAAFSEGLAGSAANKAALKIGAMNNARTAARTEGRALKFDVAGLGRNLPGAGANASQLAMQASSGALSAGTVPSANARADAGLVNTGYGAAMQGNQSAGNLLLGQYQSQLDAWRASQNNDLFGGISSLAFGLGSLGWKPFASSKDVKERRHKIAQQAILKGIKSLPVEQWDYKAGVEDGGTHIGPYAEDVKERFGDQAAPGGKAIDLVSMNGIALAGVKALAEKVERLEGAVAKSGIRGKGRVIDGESKRINDAEETRT